ncbi:protein of unknown function [Cardinium endosymbiont cEper1 of Encarsia pergandiella]|nr:protein of unknown function [Cardinium endosymbiont cEper1 of Encarsia pergandiella]
MPCHVRYDRPFLAPTEVSFALHAAGQNILPIQAA